MAIDAKVQQSPKKLSLAEVRTAIKRADEIMENNRMNQRTILQYKGYKYYKDNPALTVHEAVRRMLEECGI